MRSLIERRRRMAPALEGGGPQVGLPVACDDNPDTGQPDTGLPATGGTPAMSRRAFGRGVALAAPVVLAGGILDRGQAAAATGGGARDEAVGGVLKGTSTGVHGSGGDFGVLGTTGSAGAFGVYGYAGTAGSAAVGGGAAEPGSYGAQLGVSGPGSFAVHADATGERSTAVLAVAHADHSTGVHGVAYGHESTGVYADASSALETSHALWA